MWFRPLRLALVPVFSRRPSGLAWNNSQSGNTTTNAAAECGHSPYATRVWVGDQALALLPDEEKAWLLPVEGYIVNE
jgi:hypothetical protein